MSQTLSDKDSASGARCVPRSLLKQRCNLAMALLAGIGYRDLSFPTVSWGLAPRSRSSSARGWFAHTGGHQRSAPAVIGASTHAHRSSNSSAMSFRANCVATQSGVHPPRLRALTLAPLSRSASTSFRFSCFTATKRGVSLSGVKWSTGTPAFRRLRTAALRPSYHASSLSGSASCSARGAKGVRRPSQPKSKRKEFRL